MPIVKELLRYGANPNSKGQLGRTDVHLAISGRKVLAALHLNGANPSVQDDNGDTPLHLILPLKADDPALKNVIDDLISSDAALNLTNNAGLSSFHQLAERTDYSKETLELFIKFLGSGATIDIDFPNGKSLFHRFLAVAGAMFV